METNEVLSTENSGKRQKPEQIASWRHFTGFLLIAAGVAALGFLGATRADRRQSRGNRPACQPQQSDSHLHVIAIFMDLGAAVLLPVFGVHRRGGKSLGTFGRAMDFVEESSPWTWGLRCPSGCCGRARRMAFMAAGPGWQGRAAGRTVASLLPRSLLEVLLWIATSITAGICEEMVFRGYLQRQLHALSWKRCGGAVLGQGLVFGLGHSYQGWREYGCDQRAGGSVWRAGRMARKSAH